MIWSKPCSAGSISGRELAIAAVVLTLMAVGVSVLYLYNYGTPQGDNDNQGGDDNIGTGLGQTAPDFTLTDIDGHTFSLSDHRGNVVVIDFMATWCGPCTVEMGHLKEIHADYGAQGVRIMSIDIDPAESDETIRQLKSTYGDEWTFASGFSVGTTYGVAYIPTIYIIDQQGKVVYKNVGVASSSVLSSEIDKLL